METLVPVSDSLPAFSGLIRYEKEFSLDEKPGEAWFTAENVYESLRLTVNGLPAGICLTPPYALEISEYLKPGRNCLCAETATTPARDQMNYPRAPLDFSHEALEDSGMVGRVTLNFR